MDNVTKKLQLEIISKSEDIAKILKSGHDVELRKDGSQKIRVIEVRKTTR